MIGPESYSLKFVSLQHQTWEGVAFFSALKMNTDPLPSSHSLLRPEWNVPQDLTGLCIRKEHTETCLKLAIGFICF